MMKRFFYALLAFAVVACLWQGPPSTQAGITCTLPVTLQNGTTADASQVMADFNQVTSCFQNNIAASGANSDITGLFGLTTPIAPAQGGTPLYIGTNSTGAPNAQVISTTTPANFTLQGGRSVQFTAGFTNTAATTMNVASSGIINLFKRTQAGPVAMIGGEIIAGNTYIITYDGTQWQLVNWSVPKVAPTVTRLTTGGATYTTPTSALWIELWVIGSGGGGATSAVSSGQVGNNGGDTCWAASGPACTTPIYKGGGGQGGGTSAGGPGGTVTGSCQDSQPGQAGAANNTNGGSSGGGSIRGGGGSAPFTGTGGNGVVNSGGGGAGGAAGAQIAGPGGGGGGACFAIISAPAASYTYQIGAGGTGGSNACCNSGGNGSDGLIVVVEHYN